MKFLSIRPQKLFALALLLAPFCANATNGYFLIGYGAKSRGMGGVGTAYATDGLAAAANPAGMTDVKIRGAMRADAGLEFFNPPRAVIQDSNALESGFPGSGSGVNHESGANEFLIPNMGMIYKFNRKLTIGFAAVGAGANTRYEQGVPGLPTCVNGNTAGGVGSTFFNFNCNGDSDTVGVTLYQMQMLPSVAYKVNRNNSVGASLAFGVQMFRAYGLGAFQDLGFAGTTTNVSGEGNDWSYGGGVRLGWLGKFFDKRLNVGVNWSSRVYMTEFDKYKNLFAEQGDFDIPGTVSLGMAFKATKKLTIAADIQSIFYGDIAAINNTGPSVVNPGDLNINGSCRAGADPTNPTGDDGLTPAIAANCKLGGDDGMGFGWDDQLVYKVGVNYDYNPNWSFRAGYNYGEIPMESNEVANDQVLFNMLAPAITEHHLTMGASYRPNKTMEWSFNAMYAFGDTVKGPSAFGPTGVPATDATINSIALDMDIYTLGISFGFEL